MLEIRNLSKHYRATVALDKVSFTAQPGEVTGYLGPNGSGKSTTVKIIAGLLTPTDGEVLFRGRSIRDDMIGYKQRIGYVPEEPFLYTHLTGSEYLQFIGELRGIPERRLREKSDEFLRLLGLYGDRFVPLSSYSKGMRQKVLIAAALLDNPEIVILDEPFSGLDVNSALLLRRVVQGLAEAGKIVLFSSHVLEVVEKVCSTVVILHKGKRVAFDSVSRLRELMAVPSLEDIFSQLVVEADVNRTADQFMDVVQG